MSETFEATKTFYADNPLQQTLSIYQWRTVNLIKPDHEHEILPVGKINQKVIRTQLGLLSRLFIARIETILDRVQTRPASLRQTTTEFFRR